MDRGHRTVSLVFVCLAGVLLCFGFTSPAEAQLNQTKHYDGWILAAAHTPGLEGSNWRTDLWVRFESVNEADDLELFFCKQGQDNSSLRGIRPVLIPGKKVYYFEDVVNQFVDLGGDSWLGAIHYVSDGSPLQVWARVYSINTAGTASYGQLVEGIPTADMSPDNSPWNSSEQQWLYALKHTASGRFRVNVGIVNPTAQAGHYFLQMYDAYGILVGGASAEVDVPPFSMVQLGDPFGDVLGGEWSEMEIRVEQTIDNEAGGFAYASIVDNNTNDAFFVRGVKNLTPDQ